MGGHLHTESGANAMAEKLRAAALARGLRIEPHWVQAVGIVDVRWACNTAHLLMHPNQRERPDGLIIADDNLVEPAVAGVVAAGVRVGEEADIVAHCNFPLTFNTVAPVTRLGFDARRILNLCIENIERQRRGEAVPREALLPAGLENETAEAVLSW